MKKVLIIVLVIVLLAAAGAGGYFWYRNTHIFVEDAVYAKDSQTLDLRGTGASLEHYLQVRSQLPDCEIFWDVPFQGKLYSNNITAISVTSLGEKDLDMLVYFEELKTVNAPECTDYTVLELLTARFPHLTVNYLVELGGSRMEPDATEMTLAEGSYDYDTLVQNLQYLPHMTRVHLPCTNLEQDLLDALAAAYESIDFTYTLELMGTERDPGLTEADLSSVTAEELDSIIAQLSRFTALSRVELMDADGKSQLTLADVKKLNEALPGVTFHYTFDFYGVKISTTDEEVYIKSKNIGDAGADNLRAALAVMENCRRFVLDYCRFSDEVLAGIRDEFRDTTKVVWRVWFGKGGSLTDAQIIRFTDCLNDSNSYALRYCEDVVYMDIGHNDPVTDLSFVAHMPDLEFIIASGCSVRDLTPFANCKKLRILELVFCGYLTDLSPLAQCESLEMLNIGNTNVKDLSPLDDLNLTMLAMQKTKVPYDERTRFIEEHPDCLVTVTGNPYGPGWRYDDDDNQLEWYLKIKELFHYETMAYNRTGWYLD